MLATLKESLGQPQVYAVVTVLSLLGCVLQQIVFFGTRKKKTKFCEVKTQEQKAVLERATGSGMGLVGLHESVAQQVLDRSADAAFLFRSGQLAYANPVAQQVFGVYCSVVMERLQQLPLQGGLYECYLPGPDGAEFCANIRVAPFAMEGEVGLCVLLPDYVMTAAWRAQTPELGRSFIEQMERERQHLAAELHDDIAQQLVALKFQLHALSRTNVTAEASRAFEQLQPVVDSILSNVRSLSHGLHAVQLDCLGLERAMRVHAERIAEGAQLQVTLTLSLSQEWLPDTYALVIFRVYQEALGNVLRHSQASQVAIDLFKAADRFVLTVKDNGMGFDGAAGRGEGLGLCSMRARAAALGGSVEIVSGPGQGTQLCMQLPG